MKHCVLLFKFVEYSCGYDDRTGKQIRKRKTVTLDEGLSETKREKELIRQYALFEEEVRNQSNMYADKGNMSFGQFAQKWLEDYSKFKLADKTVERYKLLLLRINEALRNIKLREIEPDDIIRLMNKLAKDGTRNDHKYILKDEHISYIKENKKRFYEVVNQRTVANVLKGKTTNGNTARKIADVAEIKVSALFTVLNDKTQLSKQTQLHHYKLLNTILNKAVKRGYISRNPVAMADEYCPRVERREIESLNGAEIDKMLKLIDSEPLKYQVAVYIAVLGGLRVGEVMALEWADIDFNTNKLGITKSLQYISGQGSTPKDTKNESSNRDVQLPERAMLKLREWQNEQSIERQNAGNQWKEKNYIFSQWNGERMFYSTISHWFKKWISATDLPNITFHGLRHSHASWLIAQDVNYATVSKRLGHSSIVTTLNFYTHVDNKKDEDVANNIDNWLA